MLSQELETLRLDTLDALDIFDTAPEPAFDHVTQLASDLFDVPVALISLIDRNRQWFKSCVGLDIDGTSRDIAFCDVAIATDEVLVVPDATKDPRFFANPLVTGAPGIRFYAGAPITFNGVRVGTLCIIDYRPRTDFDDRSVRLLRRLADTVAAQLELRKKAIVSQINLRVQTETQKKLEMMEEVAGVGYWHVDLATRALTWSKGIHAIHGTSALSYRPDLDTALEWYHPDDRETVRATYREAVASDGLLEIEHRIVRTDGDVRNVHVRGMVTRDSDGQPQSVFGILADFTDRAREQDRLAQSEARYRLLADHANDLVLQITLDGRVSYVSPSAERLTGLAPDDIVGRVWCEMVHPDDADLLPQKLRQLVASGRMTSDSPLLYRLIRRDGALRWFEGQPRIVPGLDGAPPSSFVTIIRDVTDAVAARERVEASEKHLRTLADSVPGMVSYWDTQHRCRFANKLYREWFGRSTEEMTGIHALDLMGAEAFAEIANFLDRAHAGDRVEFSRSRLKPDGTTGHLWVQILPDIHENGDVLGVFVLATDVTPMKEKELALESLNQALVNARQEAETAAEVKSEFLATMSHEIRTPLTAILGYGALLREASDVGPKTAEHIFRLNRAGKALLTLVNDILDMSKLEAGQVVLSEQATNVADLLHDIVAHYAVVAEAKALALSIAIAGDVPPTLMVDDTRLTQVLNNLIGNACKFTRAGSVTVSVHTAGRADTTAVRFEVSDTGPGIDAAGRDKLFQRFQQGDGSITRKFGGTGLGLAICREIVALMGGTIGVASDTGQGSTFWFEIPLNRAAIAEPATAPPVIRAFSLSRILVVDDHAIVRDLLKTILQPYAPVTEAANGAEAIAACLRDSFDLIIMDMHMPELDGLSAARTIREQCAKNAATRIIALTAGAYNLSAGPEGAFLFDAVLTKPVDARRIIETVSTLAA